jgi:hypothetical protein
MDQRTLYPVNQAGEGQRMFSSQMEVISIFELFLTNYTFVDFSKDGQMASIFAAKAKRLCNSSQGGPPSERVSLQNIWFRKTFLIRPDDHVAWRAQLDPQADVDVEDVLLVAVGQRFSQDQISNQPGADEKSVRLKEIFFHYRQCGSGKGRDVSRVPK